MQFSAGSRSPFGDFVLSLLYSTHSPILSNLHPRAKTSFQISSSISKDSLYHFLTYEPVEMGIFNFLTLLPSLWLLLVMTNFSSLFALTNTATTTTTNVSSITFDGETNGNSSGIGSSSSSTNPPISLSPPPQHSFKSKGSPFRPSIAVIVGVLTTVFSVTFLLLLYAKHCRRGDNNYPFSSNSRGGYPPVTARKNSGIDRAVIESLPIFRFASLRGQKDGLECAVCLNKFEPAEVLRLLPKCKHAFHVECVDTWLDAHSTCPLCRYRVDPEDILLVEDNRIMYQTDTPPLKSSSGNHPTPEAGSISRVSGRHSFAGNSLEVIVETPKRGGGDSTSFAARRSLDSWSSKKKRHNSEIAGVGCFDRPRKDELLLVDKTTSTSGGADGNAEQRRVEHRIIISGGRENETLADGPNHRWSDVQPSDLLFLRSEMILGDSRRFSGSRRSGPSFGGGKNNSSNGGSSGAGRNVINTRSVSEITGMSRFRSNEEEENDEQHQRQRQQGQQRQEEQRKRQAAGAVSRWMAWISQSQSQTLQHQHPEPAGHPTTTSSVVV